LRRWDADWTHPAGNSEGIPSTVYVVHRLPRFDNIGRWLDPFDTAQIPAKFAG
jgi:hypothetical protein